MLRYLSYNFLFRGNIFNCTLSLKNFLSSEVTKTCDLKQIVWLGISGRFYHLTIFLRGGWIFTVQKIHQGRLRGHLYQLMLFLPFFDPPPLTGVCHFGQTPKIFRTAKIHPTPPSRKIISKRKIPPKTPFRMKFFELYIFVPFYEKKLKRKCSM